MKALYPLVLIFCLSAMSVSAQSYFPGGLGNSSLIIWLNSNKNASITQNGSSQVSQWADLSGNSYHFTQATTASKPVYGATTGPNSRPALTFTSTSSQYLSTPTLPASISYTAGVSSFSVAKFNASQTTQGYDRIYDFGAGQGANNIWFGRKSNSANLCYESWYANSGDQTYTTNNPIVNGSNDIYETIHQPGTLGSTSSVIHYVGGAAMTSTGAAGSSITFQPAALNRNLNYIARSNWAVDNYFAGTISEVLFYKTAMNTTQRTILENYLSAEWGLSVSVSKYTTPTAAAYGTSLVGIGYTSAGDNFPADLAGSTDGLGFSSTTGTTGFLKTAGYLMAAHNGQANTILNNTTIPMIRNSSGTIGRWNRSWYTQMTAGNSAGVVTLNFNFNDYNGTTPTSTYSYGLLYNPADGNFGNSSNKLVATNSTSIAGNLVSFVVNATTLANGYYTLVWSTTGVLPLLVNSFDLIRVGEKGLLTWTCTGDMTAGLFEVERRTDTASAFATIAALPVKNDGGIIGSYHYTHNHPAAGWNEYRLKIAGADGIITYSPVRSIRFGTDAGISISLYPNPVTDQLHLTLQNAEEEIVIRITNTAGQLIRTWRPIAAGTVDIPVNELGKGVYFVTVSNGRASVTKKFMKH